MIGLIFATAIVVFLLYHYKTVRALYTVTYKPFALKRSVRESVAQQFAIACGAHMRVMNGAYINSFATGIATPSPRRMFDWWGFNDRASAIDVIKQTLESGHQQYFAIIRDVIRSVEPASWDRALTSIQRSNDLDRNLVDYKDKLLAGQQRLLDEGIVKPADEVASVAAWDYGRVINIARWSYALGYITEPEAWSYIMEAATRMQQLYPSWEAMSQAYITGRHMWGGDQDSKEMTEIIHRRLLTHEKSPWRTIPWHTPLTGEVGRAEIA